MLKINVHEAKAHLSRYLDKLLQGETIWICRRNVPVAELRALAAAPESQRPFGEHPDLKVPDDINAPLTDEELSLWDGQ